MRHIAIILAACSLMAADLQAESTVARQHTAWPEEQDETKKPLSKWLPSVLGRKGDAEAAPEPEPAADPAPAPRKQKARNRPKAPEPVPEPQPKLTPEEQAAEDKWWKETGDPAVSAFSQCLVEHVTDETSRGSKASYPDFVTTAMNSRCSGEFAAMAQLILDRHGEEGFARIARQLIATKFVPAVKQVVEGGPLPAFALPQDDRPRLEAEMRRSKEAMFGCLVDNADRMAAGPETTERVADRVMAACQVAAEAYFGKLEQLYPGATGGKPGEASEAILDASYRPAIIQRITSLRGDTPDAAAVRRGSGKADAEAIREEGPQAASEHRQASQATGEAFSPPGPPAPGSPVPASSRP